MKEQLSPLQFLPLSFDQRELGLTTMAKDQSQCGCSQAFSVVALFENAMLLDHQ